MIKTSIKATQCCLIIVCFLTLSGCIGTVIGAVVDTTIAVVKIPFKVGGAVIDVVTDDDDFTDVQLDSQLRDRSIESDAAAVEMEGAEF